MSDEVDVIDGNQVVKIKSGADGDGIELTLVVAPNEGTPEERIQAAAALYGWPAILYHYVTGAKTSGRNKAGAYVANADDPVSQEELEEFMKNWKPAVGTRGGPKKSDKEKALDMVGKLDAEVKKAFLDQLMADIKAEAAGGTSE